MWHQLSTTQGSGNTEGRRSESSKMTIRAFPWRTGTQPLSVGLRYHLMSGRFRHLLQPWCSPLRQAESNGDKLVVDQNIWNSESKWRPHPNTQNIVLCQVIWGSDRKLMTMGIPSGSLRCYEFCFSILIMMWETRKGFDWASCLLRVHWKFEKRKISVSDPDLPLHLFLFINYPPMYFAIFSVHIFSKFSFICSKLFL